MTTAAVDNRHDSSRNCPAEKKKSARFADFDIKNKFKNINQCADNNDNPTADSESINVPKDLFLNCPVDLPNFPVAFPQLERTQQQDEAIQATTHCTDKVFCDHTLKGHERNDGSSKIALSEAFLIAPTIKWCHHTLGHAGADQLLCARSSLLTAEHSGSNSGDQIQESSVK